MTEADKMFDELGFHKMNTSMTIIKYEKDLKFIGFDLVNKQIIYKKKYITKSELKAINQKCKELGWL